MDLIQIYQCLCDRTRLRILNLLARSPLCVCHFQDILGEPQVKISKHLAYLRRRGMVSTAREQNWVIYSLPDRRADELERNLKCLQDCVQTDAVFKRDVEKLSKLAKNCCKPRSLFRRGLSERRTNAKTKRSVYLRS
jgi:ArsR family transcriptional regulator